MNNDEQIKKAINDFIWQYAPASLTIGHAELIACKMFDAFKEGTRGVPLEWPAAYEPAVQPESQP